MSTGQFGSGEEECRVVKEVPKGTPNSKAIPMGVP